MVLSVRQLRASYRSTAGEFFLPSLDLPVGAVVALSGPTGCGKTTLVNALFQWQFPGLVSYERAEFMGVDLRSLPRQTLYRRVSYMPQFSLSGLNPTLTVGTHVRHIQQSVGSSGNRAYLGWLQALQLDQGALNLRPHQLSGGMKQRVFLLLALLKQPDLLILDEPSTAVDVVTLRLLVKLLLELKESSGLSLLLVSHDRDLVRRLADQVVSLEKGQEKHAAASD